MNYLKQIALGRMSWPEARRHREEVERGKMLIILRLACIHEYDDTLKVAPPDNLKYGTWINRNNIEVKSRFKEGDTDIIRVATTLKYAEDMKLMDCLED